MARPTSGSMIATARCGASLSWEKSPGGVDSHNPNPAERTRPTLGLHILLAMRPTKPGLWEGEVYNAENGKTYNPRSSA